MVYLLGGYPMTFPDAKAWALRNWPDMDIYDDDHLPLIIAQYHRERNMRFRCIALVINDDDLVVFFPRFGADDPSSTPYKHRELIETSEARQFKDWLFRNERPGDRELAAKTKWMTVADPYFDWHYREKARAEYRAAQAAKEHNRS